MEERRSRRRTGGIGRRKTKTKRGLRREEMTGLGKRREGL